MEFRQLEIIVKNARNLKNVRRGKLLKMAVYVAVSICSDPNTEQRTPVDEDGGTNPDWNHEMKFTIDESAAQEGRLTLVFRLRCDRTFGDRDVGVLHVNVKQLLETIGASPEVTGWVVTNSGGQGELNYSYRVGERIDIADKNETPLDVGNSSQQRRQGFMKRAARKIGVAAAELGLTTAATALVGFICHSISKSINDEGDDHEDEATSNSKEDKGGEPGPGRI